MRLKFFRWLFKDHVDRTFAKFCQQNFGWWEPDSMRTVSSLLDNPSTEGVGHCVHALAMIQSGIPAGIACGRLAKASDAAVVRYALPEVVEILAESDSDRAKALLRSGREQLGNLGFCLSPNRRLSLVVTSAYLGYAEGVETFSEDLRRPSMVRVQMASVAKALLRSGRELSGKIRSLQSSKRQLPSAAKSAQPWHAENIETNAEEMHRSSMVGLPAAIVPKVLLRSGREQWGKIRPYLSPKRYLSLETKRALLWYFVGVNTFIEVLHLTLMARTHVAIVKRLLAEQQRTARKLGVNADYASIHAVTRKNCGNERSVNKAGGGQQGKASGKEGGDVQALAGNHRVQIGLFDYCSPKEPSINLGDYIQTISVIGQLSKFSFGDLKAPEAVRDLLAQGHMREGETTQTISRSVKLVPINRDFPLVSAAEGPIWLPVCCWLGREAYPGRFDFPFPSNIRPLFLSLHIADPSILTEESLDYFRRFEPIGCRDIFTVRLLRGAGVKAFFNGCAALTLDRLRPPLTGERLALERRKNKSNRYQAIQSVRGIGGNKPIIVPGLTVSPHDDEDCYTRDFNGNLRAAVALLDRYRAAEEVCTDRLHCYLPCLAMNVPVKLDLSRIDSRLDGLADLDSWSIRYLVKEFEAIAQPVLAAVLEGRSEAEVYALWRDVTAPAMVHTDELIAERNIKYPLPEVQVENLGLEQIPVQVFGTASDPDGNAVHLLFNFDKNFVEFFPHVFEGIWRNASRPLVVHIFARELDTAVFESWAVLFKGVRLIRYDLSDFNYPNHLGLLPHITVSTMDRLLAPVLLPDVKKIIYLDSDILVRTDIADLFDIDLGDVPLAARGEVDKDWKNAAMLLGSEGYMKSYSYDENRFERFRNVFFSGGATVFEGFNAGVLVMNLAKMREERAVEKMLSILQACGVDDQIILNLYVRERWKPLAKKWNIFPFEDVKANDVGVLHFKGPSKPWTLDRPVPFWEKWLEKEWLENAERILERQSALEISSTDADTAHAR